MSVITHTFGCCDYGSDRAHGQHPVDIKPQAVVNAVGICSEPPPTPKVMTAQRAAAHEQHGMVKHLVIWSHKSVWVSFHSEPVMATWSFYDLTKGNRIGESSEPSSAHSRIPIDSKPAAETTDLELESHPVCELSILKRKIHWFSLISPLFLKQFVHSVRGSRILWASKRLVRSPSSLGKLSEPLLRTLDGGGVSHILQASLSFFCQFCFNQFQLGLLFLFFCVYSNSAQIRFAWRWRPMQFVLDLIVDLDWSHGIKRCLKCLQVRGKGMIV